MLKVTIALSVLFVSTMLFTNSLANPAYSSEVANEDELTPDQYAALIQTVKRGFVARMILDDAEYEPEQESKLEKRFPKWRTGDTKARVDRLKYNKYQPSSAWANSMREKNKLYEKIHG